MGMYGGGGAPAPATPSPEEKKLLELQAISAQKQLQSSERQEAENAALMPLLMSEYGLNRFEDVSKADPRIATLQAERAQLVAQQPAASTPGAPGFRGARGTAVAVQNPRIAAIDKEMAGLDQGGKTTVRYEKQADAATDKRKEIEGLQLDRSLKALKGELPVTATLTKELELGKRKLQEKLSKQLGPGWELSSPGITANAEYDRMSTSLKEAEQRDQLTTAEALSINRQQSRAGNTEGTMSTASTPNITASQLLSGAGTGARGAIDYYGTLRNASLKSKEMAGSETSGYISGALGAAGLGLGAFMALSDPESKTDIEPVDDGAMLLAVRKMPVKKWRYKEDPEKRKHIGAMADVMPEIVSDGKQFDVISYLGMLTGSIRALDKKVEKEDSPALLLTT